MRKITIDPEFSKLLPERPIEELEEQILADGKIMSPLVVWKDDKLLRLLDGHRRNRIMERHPRLKAPSPIIMEFESRLEAHDWLIHNQRSRRNITDEEDRYLVGKLCLTQKPRQGQHASSDTVSYEQMAEKTGKSERTLRRSAQFAEAVDAAEEIKSEVLIGEAKATTESLKEFASLPPKAKEKATEAVRSGTPLKAAVAKAKPAKKGGKVVFDYKKWESVYGSLVRLIDDHHRAVPDAKMRDCCLDSLNTCLADFNAWKRKKHVA